MADRTLCRIGTFVVLAGFSILTSCGKPCPEGQIYVRGQVHYIWIYNAALKTSQMMPIYPQAECKEARRG